MGGNITLSVTVLPDNADSQAVSWSSSNTKIAEVNKDGTVSGVGSGKVTITATASNGVSASKKTNNRFTITVDLDDIAAGRFPSEYMDWLATFDWSGTLNYLDVIAGKLPYEAAIPMPKHGRLSGGQKGTTVNFKVDAASTETYIVMKEAYTGKLAATAFCDPGKQVTVYVPSGDYVIVWGSGPYWYGEPLLFANLGSYNKSEIVTIAGSQYYHTYTLVASDDGDVGMYDANPEDLLGK